MGKKCTSILMFFMVISVFSWSILFAGAEREAWDCPECGRTGNTGNYCGGCAHPAPNINNVPGFSFLPDDLKATIKSIFSEADSWKKVKDVPYTFSSFPLHPSINMTQTDSIESFSANDSAIVKGDLYDSSIYDLQQDGYLDIADIPLEGEWVCFIHWKNTKTNTIEWYSEYETDTMISWDYKIGTNTCLITLMHPNYYKSNNEYSWHFLQLKYDVKKDKLVSIQVE